jgi:DNA polymerase delta subunit 2
MLEDESGRVRLVGQRIAEAGLVTGVILGALGLETAGGDFEVVDICYAGMAPQLHDDAKVEEDDDEMDVDEESPSSTDDEHIAIVSGFDIGNDDVPDAEIQMLTEYLSGEASVHSSTRISRLVIAGNSIGFAGEVGHIGDLRRASKKKPVRALHSCP